MSNRFRPEGKQNQPMVKTRRAAAAEQENPEEDQNKIITINCPLQCVKRVIEVSADNNDQDKKEAMQKHLAFFCREMPMQCQNCDIILGRTDFEGHRRECKKAQIPDDRQLKSLVTDEEKDKAMKELLVV